MDFVIIVTKIRLHVFTCHWKIIDIFYCPVIYVYIISEYICTKKISIAPYSHLYCTRPASFMNVGSKNV